MPAAPFIGKVEGEPRAAELKVTGESVANDLKKLKELEEDFQGAPMEYVSGPADEAALRERWDATKRALEELKPKGAPGPDEAPAPKKPTERVF